MEFIFHETQEGSLCAQHCLNSLLQGDYFSAVELANIANELDRLELKFMSEAGTSTSDFQSFLNQESNNYDDTGYFSIQVLQKALKTFNLELIPIKSELATKARENPIEQNAYICNFKNHWYTIRRIAKYWFNLNSLLNKPELISDTYLSVLLAQLQNDGYSIFIVEGELPRCQAEIKLYQNPINEKNVLAKQYKEKSFLKISSNLNRDFDDEELKKAIQMSLAENDLDLDNQQFSKLYPSLAHEQIGSGTNIDSNFGGINVVTENDDEEDLKKAIALSLENNDHNTDRPTTSKTLHNSSQVESVQEIRKKRLEFLNKNLSNNSN